MIDIPVLDDITNNKWVILRYKVGNNVHETRIFHRQDDWVIEHTYMTRGDDTGSMGSTETYLYELEDMWKNIVLNESSYRNIEHIVVDTKEELYDELESTFKFIRDLADPMGW